MDAKVVKIWDRQNGKAYTSIESAVEFNDLAVFPGSGLMLMTCEQPKMQVHYIPSMGPSPRFADFAFGLCRGFQRWNV
jgi:ribosome biogenesis protein ENP2